MNSRQSEKSKNVLKWGLITAAVLVGTFLFLFCDFHRCPAQEKPNVVIILIDTLRADHCSVYGYNRETTPHMKGIAEGGLKLEYHFANSPWTKPSTASIISGLYPTAHGSRIGQFEDLENQVSPVVEVLNPRVKTMAEILKENGYITYAFVTNYHLTPEFGYAQGYDHYYFAPEGSDIHVVCRKDKKLVETAMKKLRKNKGKPLFIWCHLMAVHGYRFPREFDKFQPEDSTPIPPGAEQTEIVENFKSIEEAVADYDNSILYTDHLVGEFFDFILKYAPNTIFIVTSDHGEEFYEHGGFEHARTLYNEILKVPCIIWGPGVPTGVFTGISDTIDLLPTIMKNVGIEVSGDLRGQPIFSKNKISGEYEKVIFAEQHHRGDYKRFAMIWKGKKMIVNQHKLNNQKTFEFYNNAFSIEKKNAITGMDQNIIEKLKQKIDCYKRVTELFFKEKMGQLKYKHISKNDIKYLRSLGYVK